MTELDAGFIRRLEAAIESRDARPVGAHLRFLCPAHDDHHPSADWHRKKHTWTCRSCGEGGGAFDLARRLDVELPDRPDEATPRRPEIEAVYSYTDEYGDVLYQAIRYRPKSFRQRQPDGNGGWIWNVAGVRKVPYNLTGIMASQAEPWDMPTVYIVEGERDADRLIAMGCVATTNVGGAGKWTEDLSVYLLDRKVVILPDNDDAGRKHASVVAATLNGITSEVRIVELPGLPEKGDVSDWLDRGGTVEQLEQLVIDADTRDRSGRLQLLTPAELMTRPKPRWILEDVLVEDSLACIAGPPGTYKSFIALSMHFAIAAGIDWHGRFVVQGPSVYVVAEGVRGMALRVKAWERGYMHRAAPECARFVADPLQLAGGAADDLLDAIQRWGQVPRLIVFDTLSRTAVGLEENSAKEMGQYIAEAERLKRETQACVLFIHHVSRAGGNARGSTSLEGAFDTIINVSEEQQLITLSCKKQKDAGEFHQFRLTPQVIDLGDGDSSVILAQSTFGEDVNRNSAAALRILDTYFGTGGATSTEWLNMVKQQGAMSEASFYRARKSLADTGRVVSDSSGRGARYRPAGQTDYLRADLAGDRD